MKSVTLALLLIALGCADSHGAAGAGPGSEDESLQQGDAGQALPMVADTAGSTASAYPATDEVREVVLDPVCADVAKLAACDGTISFQSDGSAVVSLWLENIGDDDFLSYPGLGATWWVADTYTAPQSEDLFLYGLLAHQRFEHTFTVPREALQIGHALVVRAAPFTLGSRDVEGGCPRVGALDFSVEIPR